MVKNNYPLISIAMTTYNGEEYLKEQLDSILNQTYRNLEIIICDDGSKDNTIQIINEYINNYEFIKLFQNEKNLGYAKNFEKAINLCTSKYIALSDQDDLWEEKKLEILLTNLQIEEKKNPDLPILVHSDLCMIDENNKVFNESYFKYRKYKLKNEKDLGHILGPCGVMGNTLLFNNNLKNKILPFPISVENHDYWIALINEIYGKRITLNEKLVKYRIHSSNTSNCKSKRNHTQKVSTLLKMILKNDFYIPYIKTKRFQLISYLLRNYKIPKKDKLILIKFQEYLSTETYTYKKIYNVLRYSFYKRDYSYRFIFIFALFIKKNISKSNFYIYNISQIFFSRHFKGWGKKNSGKFAMLCKKIFKGKVTILEDGFIRSFDLKKSLIESFSIVEDDIGIYYDATAPSRLENILLNYDFYNDRVLMNTSKEAIELIIKYNISKYNHSKDLSDNYFSENEEKILVIVQIEEDKSLKYGLTNNFTLDDLVKIALEENPDSKIYIKIHPDEILKDNYNIKFKNDRCKIISEDLNSISLLKNFEKVYTRTSQMGFEAILLGKKCVCFGMPFYAGWGITDDRVLCPRRKRELVVEEVFAASYILYTKYMNPYTKNKIDIIEAIKTIEKLKNE